MESSIFPESPGDSGSPAFVRVQKSRKVRFGNRKVHKPEWCREPCPMCSHAPSRPMTRHKNLTHLHQVSFAGLDHFPLSASRRRIPVSRSNQVGHLWLVLPLKPMNPFLLLAIGMSHPHVLTQMF